MADLIIFEDAGYRDLLPLTYWRSCGELRTGYGCLIDYIRDCCPAAAVTLYCRADLAAVTAERWGWPVNVIPQGSDAWLVNSRLLLTSSLDGGPLPAVQWHDDVPVIIRADAALLDRLTPEVLSDSQRLQQVLAPVPAATFVPAPRLIRYPWDLVQANSGMLEFCWRRAGAPGEIHGRITEGVYLLNRSGIYVGPGSTIKPGVVLDAENGPIYIGANVTISPNVSIEGPCYVGDGSLIQPGAVLRDGMNVGLRCKVGGELDASIIHGYSNKQHDGFLGHAYVAEWVNLAADTVNSDLKNTYGPVRVPVNGIEVDSGLMFVGVTVGDHSKTGIGQMIPTGAVIGFGSNVATCEFAPRFVRSFTWLTRQGPRPYEPQRCLEVAKRVMARRQVVMSPAQEALFQSIPTTARRFEVAGSRVEQK